MSPSTCCFPQLHNAPSAYLPSESVPKQGTEYQSYLAFKGMEVALRESVKLICGTPAKKGWPHLYEPCACQSNLKESFFKTSQLIEQLLFLHGKNPTCMARKSNYEHKG